MFATPVLAATGPAAASGGMMAMLVQFAPFILIIILFYFMLIRPQQKRAAAHRAMVAGVKRGDTVVMSNGMVGKVTRVEEEEAMVEVSQGVNVRVIKSMLADVRTRGEPVAANDSKKS